MFGGFWSFGGFVFLFWVRARVGTSMVRGSFCGVRWVGFTGEVFLLGSWGFGLFL